MSSVRELHDQAIGFGHLAIAARETGDFEGAIELARRAFELESSAASLVPDGRQSEPTRSILYRSAASFAFQCRDFAEASRMVGLGLSGYPPQKIQKDLLFLLDQIKFSSYLQEQGELLESGELLLSMYGNAVGHGIVTYKEFKDRIELTFKLVNKTIQRLMGRSYQIGGRIAQEYKVFEQAIAVPMAQNSFAMMIKLIRREDTHQTNLFVQDAQQVINEIIHGAELLDSNQEVELREHIADEKYYSNFVYLVRQIAPDGDKISRVILSSTNLSASLTRKRGEIEPADTEDKATVKYDPIDVVGILKYADAGFRKDGEQTVGVEISDSEKKYIKPGAGIDDLVEQYWQRRVRIIGRTDGENIFPTDIIPIGDE